MAVAKIFSKYSCKFDLQTMLKMVEEKMREGFSEKDGGEQEFFTTTQAVGWNKMLFFNPKKYEKDLSKIEVRKSSRSRSEVEDIEQQITNLREKRKTIGDSCSDFLSSELSVKNCIRLYRFGIEQMFPSLRDSAETFIKDNVEKVFCADNKDFLQLSFEELHSLLPDRLNIDDQEPILRDLLAWIHKDERNRKSRLSRVLHSIDFRKCTPRFLKEEVLVDPICAGSESARRTITSALEDHSRNQPLLVLGGFKVKEKMTTCVEIYNRNCNKWFEYHKLDIPNRYCTAFPVGNDIVLISKGKTLKWNPESKIETELTAMPNPRNNFCGAVLGMKIYILGGRDKNGATTKCSLYNYDTNRWEEIADMKGKRYSASAAVLNGKIYCAGGYDGQTELSSMEKFDSHQNCWSTVEAMKRARCSFALVPHSTNLYALGGLNSGVALAEVEQFSLDAWSWSDVPPMKTPRAWPAAGCLGTELCVFSGVRGEFQGLTDTEIYCVDTQEWKEGPKVNVGRWAHSMCYIPSVQ